MTLNVHPADGVRAFEDAYPAMAEALGRDPRRRRADRVRHHRPRVPRRLPRGAAPPARGPGRRLLVARLAAGPHTRASRASTRCGCSTTSTSWTPAASGRRPLTFSRYAGPGSHRYPVGFSGDAHISWASLDFQPEFTATASNIGYGWWSHDIGGHIFGVRDDELATRWVQLGVFSPILRLHSSSNPFLVKEPWTVPARGARRDDARRCASATGSCRTCTR